MSIMLGAAALLMQGPAAASPAADPVPTLTLTEARRMDAATLARRVLGDSAALVDEARIAEGDTLQSIDFASAPLAAAGDICLSDRIRIGFAPLQEGDAPGPDAPMRVYRIDQDRLFRRIVPPNSAPAIGDGNAAQALLACRMAGPVLASDPAKDSYFEGMAFGSAPVSPRAMAFALHAFDVARAATAAGTTVQCDGDGQLCAAPATTFAELREDDLRSVALGHCEDMADKLCVSLNFDDPRGRHVYVDVATGAVAVGANVDVPIRSVAMHVTGG